MGVERAIEVGLREQLESGLGEGVFPGASASVAMWSGTDWRFVHAQAGKLARDLAEVSANTIYDLASLTKPFVAMTAMRLDQTGLLPLRSQVRHAIPESEDSAIGERCWEEVCSHRAGLLAWVPFYESLPHPPGTRGAREWVLSVLLPRCDPDRVGRSVYSDLGYILMGFALERLGGVRLSELVAQEVLRPLGLETEIFFPAVRTVRDWPKPCAPTGWSAWRQRMLRGEVHDENCWALGGVAGHAGLFGTSRAVARFAACYLDAWHGRAGVAQRKLALEATRPRSGGTHRLGWDGKSVDESSAGSQLSGQSFGHLGFTGTSVWCDPQRQIAIVLLSNRVAVSDDNSAIRAFRPRFHDAVVRAFDRASGGDRGEDSRLS